MSDKRSKPTTSQPTQEITTGTEIKVETMSIEGKKLRQVFSIKEVINTPNSYYKVFDPQSRWIIMLVNFNNRTLKVRIVNNVRGRIITVLNINYNRLYDIKKVISRLEDIFSIVEIRDMLKKFEEAPEEEEELFKL